MEPANVSLPIMMAITASPVDALPDSLLARIFSYLPFKDRFLLCLVSPKWTAASRIPWSDITSLNLNFIPRAMANPILDLCPMIREIEADHQTIILSSGTVKSVAENVRTVTLRNVNFESVGPGVPFKAYFGQFPKVAELTLHNTRIVCTTQCGSAPRAWWCCVLPPTTAASLRRLMLVNVPGAAGTGDLITMALRETQNLECLYLVENQKLDYCLFGLPELRELCLVSNNTALSVFAAGLCCGKFPKLEVLIYASRDYIHPENLWQLIATDSAMRILVVAGFDSLLSLMHSQLEDQASFNPAAAGVASQVPFTISAQKWYSRTDPAAGCSSLPQQIFLGGNFTKHVRFKLPPSDGPKFWRIDCPMPEYLAKPEVATVFEGVWAAKIIREGPANGLLPWGSPDETHLFYSSEPLKFC